MGDHDPLCPWRAIPGRTDTWIQGCRCDLIARVRADERERIAQEIEADRADRADLIPLCVGTQDAYYRAARIARGGAK